MLKLGQFQVKWVEMGHLSEDTGPALRSLGLGEADSPGNSPCEPWQEGSDGGAVLYTRELTESSR